MVASSESGKMAQVYVSYAAIARLVEWGFSDRDIALMAKQTGKYEYANCLEKLSRIPLVQAVPDTDEVVIPNYYADMDSEVGGECGSIATQLSYFVNTAGAIGQLREKGRRDFRFIIAGGTTPTHFNHGTHLWCGMLQDHEKSPASFTESVDEMVIFDAAFRRVDVIEESGYNLEYFRNPYLDKISMPKHEVVQVTEPVFEDETGEVLFHFRPDQAVLGVSDDRSYAYGLGFLRFNDSLSAAIVIGYPDDRLYAVGYMHPQDDSIRIATNSPEGFRPSPETGKELYSMVRAAQMIPISNTSLPAGFDLAEEISLSW